MKSPLVLIVVVNVVVAVSVNEQWISFKNEHGKIYNSIQEESLRFEIFRANLRKIENHNARYELGEETYTMGVNKFADLTQEELVEKWSMPDYVVEETTARFTAIIDVDPTPSVDWRNKGVVLDVDKQGECGSDWAFSTAGAIEGQIALKYNKKIKLSPQELLDCVSSNDTHGCWGGSPYDAFSYVQNHGISTLKDYPYYHEVGKCKNTSIPRIDFAVSGYQLVDANEEALRQAVEKVGPISVTMYNGFLFFYKGGIFEHINCPTNRNNHGLLAVGYGTENGTDFWILKNSYGEHWGENGYIRVVRNKNNMCGIANNGIYPYVSSSGSTILLRVLVMSITIFTPFANVV